MFLERHRDCTELEIFRIPVWLSSVRALFKIIVFIGVLLNRFEASSQGVDLGHMANTPAEENFNLNSVTECCSQGLHFASLRVSSLFNWRIQARRSALQMWGWASWLSARLANLELSFAAVCERARDSLARKLTWTAAIVIKSSGRLPKEVGPTSLTSHELCPTTREFQISPSLSRSYNSIVFSFLQSFSEFNSVNGAKEEILSQRIRA